VGHPIATQRLPSSAADACHPIFVDPSETIPSFASVPHISAVWNLVLAHLRDNENLRQMAWLLSIGLTDSRKLAAHLDISLEQVELRKSIIHVEVERLVERLAGDSQAAA